MDKKVVVITGASSGIGLATANFLVEKGYKVYGLALNDFEAENFTYYKCDITKDEQITEVVEKIYAQEKRIDVLINNAGMGISGAVEHTKNSSIDLIYNVNVFGTIKMTRAVLPYMKETGGNIINLSSVASELAIPFQSFYSATKASIQAFALALRNEVRPFNIKVSCVLPGDTKTGFTSARVKNEIEEDSSYGTRIKKSVATMENDEQHGMSPIMVSKTIYKLIKAKNPAPCKVVGFKYKVFMVLNKILPRKLVSFILFKMYG